MVINDRAAVYRRRATDARTLAPYVTSETDKECLLAAADNYDKLAVSAERPERARQVNEHGSSLNPSLIRST